MWERSLFAVLAVAMFSRKTSNMKTTFSVVVTFMFGTVLYKIFQLAKFTPETFKYVHLRDVALVGTQSRYRVAFLAPNYVKIVASCAGAAQNASELGQFINVNACQTQMPRTVSL